MLAPMYSCEQDRNAAARATYDNSMTYPQPCAAGRAIQLPAQHGRGGQVDPAAAAGVQQQQPRRANKKKHGARPPSRRSATTVVATDVANFRAMVQELTGFPSTAVFRPMPRRVHAVSSSPVALAAGNQGCGGGDEGRGQDAANRISSDALPAVQPVTVMAQPPQCATPPDVFDGLWDIGSPAVFDAWDDLYIE